MDKGEEWQEENIVLGSLVQGTVDAGTLAII